LSVTLIMSVADSGEVISKAVARRRQLARTGREGAAARFAQSLDLLAGHAAGLRDWDGVLVALEESVAVTRTLAQAERELFLLPLGARLLRLSIALYESGNVAGAITTAHEAAALYRRLFAERPEAVGHDFVDALKHLSCGLAVSGDAQAALAAMREAVAAHRKLNPSRGPGEETSSLAWTLGLLGMRLRLAGNFEEARAATAEAIAFLDKNGSVPESVRIYLCREYESLDARPICLPST
jgi:tetratricopeptide (TPR) repeat protein